MPHGHIQHRLQQGNRVHAMPGYEEAVKSPSCSELCSIVECFLLKPGFVPVHALMYVTTYELWHAAFLCFRCSACACSLYKWNAW